MVVVLDSINKNTWEILTSKRGVRNLQVWVITWVVKGSLLKRLFIISHNLSGVLGYITWVDFQCYTKLILFWDSKSCVFHILFSLCWSIWVDIGKWLLIHVNHVSSIYCFLCGMFCVCSYPSLVYDFLQEFCHMLAWITWYWAWPSRPHGPTAAHFI